jgi:cell division protein FtsZ
VVGIGDIIHSPGLVNVDFEDLKNVMSKPGKATMGRSAHGADRPGRSDASTRSSSTKPLNITFA